MSPESSTLGSLSWGEEAIVCIPPRNQQVFYQEFTLRNPRTSEDESATSFAVPLTPDFWRLALACVVLIFSTHLPAQDSSAKVGNKAGQDTTEVLRGNFFRRLYEAYSQELREKPGVGPA